MWRALEGCGTLGRERLVLLLELVRADEPVVHRPYFDGASALIFVFDSSAYNVCDPNDPTLNRFTDALHLFEDIASDRRLCL